ncbi:DnaJ domain-containing protein [uncultured Neisseria sp.]|uniref:DnaJ domain-containing protein n=1 Tax=uncultured Neisseria sp. TaxID=237778 RepID=UPI0025F9E589|nr:DnaJ domain-containing protein [uncultured Neisseria sp.]
MTMRTHYDNLKISRNATAQEIKKAYRRLAQKYHPDRNGNSAESQRIMKIINQAYAVLSDPESRRAYDRKLMEQEREEREAEQAKQQQQAHERQQAYERQQEQEKRQQTKEEYCRQEGYRQQKAEEIYRQYTAAQEEKVEKNEEKEDTNGVFLVIIIFIIIGLFIIAMGGESQIDRYEATNPIASASVEDSLDKSSWVNETDESNNSELELNAASSPESMQVEIENLRAQLEAAKAASEAAAEQQRQEQEIYTQNKIAQCRQIARNIGYYETLASLCEFTPKRSNNDISAQWGAEGCGNYMDINEATKETEKSARNLEDKINQIDGSESYDNFCKGQWRFWKEIDDGQR